MELFWEEIFCAVLFLLCPPVGAAGAVMLYLREKDGKKEARKKARLTVKERPCTGTRAA